MPALPAVNLPAEHYDRVVAAFPGETQAEKAESYRAWLTGHLIDFVEQREAEQVDLDYATERQRRLNELRESLPQRPAFPPPRIAAKQAAKHHG